MNGKTHWKWIGLGILALGFFLSSKGTRSYWKRKRSLRELEKKLEQARETNRNLTLEIHRLQTDPRAIEQIARRDLGLLQPGEIEYRFIIEHSTQNKN